MISLKTFLLPKQTKVFTTKLPFFLTISYQIGFFRKQLKANKAFNPSKLTRKSSLRGIESFARIVLTQRLHHRAEAKNPPKIFNCSTYLFTSTNAELIILSTISSSSKVLVSPKFVASPSAIFRKMRRIILPLRVLGNPGTI